MNAPILNWGTLNLLGASSIGLEVGRIFESKVAINDGDDSTY